jgi:hypothetical protein
MIYPFSWIKSIPKMQMPFMLEETQKLCSFVIVSVSVTSIQKYPWIFNELLDAVFRFLVPKSIFWTRRVLIKAEIMSESKLTSAPVDLSTRARIATLPISICNLMALSV